MKTDVAIVIQARLKSERLPKKILAELGSKTMLEQIFRRCRAVKVKKLNIKILVACPREDGEEIFAATGITDIFGGPEKDLLTRILDAAKWAGNAKKIVRVTADCPFVCPRMIENFINHSYYKGAPVIVNWRSRTFPNGMDLEIYDAEWLAKFSGHLSKEDEREYFAQYIVQHCNEQTVESIVNQNDLSHYRLTVDYEEDLELARKIYKAMGQEIWDAQKVVDYVRSRPALRKLNAHYEKLTGSKEENDAR